MKLKGVKKLNKEITALVQEYITDEVTCVLNGEFLYLDDVVAFTLFQDELSDRDWAVWLKDTYKKKYKKDFSLFILSFLHEVGHHFTMDDFDDDVIAKNDFTINLDNDTSEEQTAKRRNYWDLPIEKAATDWAVRFYNNHREQMAEMYEKMNRVILDFYNKNITYDF